MYRCTLWFVPHIGNLQMMSYAPLFMSQQASGSSFVLVFLLRLSDPQQKAIVSDANAHHVSPQTLEILRNLMGSPRSCGLWVPGSTPKLMYHFYPCCSFCGCLINAEISFPNVHHHKQYFPSSSIKLNPCSHHELLSTTTMNQSIWLDI